MSGRASRLVRAAAWATPALLFASAWSDADVEHAPGAPVVAAGGGPVFQPRAATQQWSIGDPTGEEQQFLELMNRARADPPAEGDRIFVDYDSQRVTQMVDFFLKARPGIEWTRAENKSAFHTYPAAPPLAFNSHLIDASRGHCAVMRQYQQQSHLVRDSHGVPVEPDILGGARLIAAGYDPSFSAESVYAYATNVLHAHAGFAIDAGQAVDPDTGRPELGHRLNLLGFDGDPNRKYVEVGIGVLATNDPKSKVGPELVTVDFAMPASGPNVFVTGVVYDDKNNNGFYDPGEGIGGVRIDLDVGDTFAVTSASGGYAIPLHGVAGTIHVTATGQTGTPGEAVGTQTAEVTVSDANVKVDFGRPPDPPYPALIESAAAGPVAVPDVGTASSSMQISAPADVSDLVGDVECEVTIDHAARQELKLTLVGPIGVEVVLFDHGPPGANLHGVFARSLAPREPLDPLVGLSYVGTWTLRVDDDVAGSAGTITGWKLRVRPQWVRTTFAHATPMVVTKLTTTNSKKPAADTLAFTAVVDVADVAPTPAQSPRLRLLAADATHAEILSVALPDKAVQRRVNGTSRTIVNGKATGLDLPALLPATVEIELSYDDVIVRETVPLKKGAFNSATAKPVSDVFHVDSVTTKVVAGTPNYTIKGRVGVAGTLVGEGTLEVSLGGFRFKDYVASTVTKSKKTTYKSASGLKAFTIDSGLGTFTLTVATTAPVWSAGALDLTLRLGETGFYGAASVVPSGSATSPTY